jgi:transcriptional regulator with XRE-family HTH domain
VDVGDSRTIGARLRQIRRARDKSLRVIAGLAGMSTTHLWRIERGERALDLSEIAALADGGHHHTAIEYISDLGD